MQSVGTAGRVLAHPVVLVLCIASFGMHISTGLIWGICTMYNNASDVKTIPSGRAAGSRDRKSEPERNPKLDL